MNQSSKVFPTPRAGLMRRVSSGAMIASNAVVCGDVTLGKDVTVWFSAVVRGDDAPISIGPETNIQDACVVHCDTGVPMSIGARCTIGHGAIVHGAQVGHDVLIGMGATILGRSVIGDGAVIAAGAVVTEGMEVPPGALVAGVPAKVIREVSPKEVAFMAHAVPHYIETAETYLADEEVC